MVGVSALVGVRDDERGLEVFEDGAQIAGERGDVVDDLAVGCIEREDAVRRDACEGERALGFGAARVGVGLGGAEACGAGRSGSLWGRRR